MNTVQFENICSKSQIKLKSYLKHKLAKRYDSVVCHDGFLYAQGSFPVLLVAHMDTVHKEVPNVFVYSDGTLSSPVGIGGDDRCGIYAILKIIEHYHCSVLFTEDEEVGCVGANKFCSSKLADSLVGKFNFIIEVDRQGSNDAVFYDCDNRDFTDFITKHFYKERFGSLSDISYIAPHLDSSAVNLSCGYYNAHTSKEYVVLSELDECITQVCNILERADDTYYEYVEAVYPTNYYNDWYGANCYGEFPYSDDTVVCYEILFAENNGCVIEEIEAISEYEALGILFKMYPHICYGDVKDVKKLQMYY